MNLVWMSQNSGEVGLWDEKITPFRVYAWRRRDLALRIERESSVV
jgi:hypothetical protein